MRARNLKPAIYANELLGVADPRITILFTATWCLADREGRFEDRPLRIKAQVFPYREDIKSTDVDQWLQWLHAEGFIVRYDTGDGRKAIQVIEFLKHQHPHKDEKSFKLPPPKPADFPRKPPGVSGGTEGQAKKPTRKARGNPKKSPEVSPSAPDVSGIQESGIQDSGIPESPIPPIGGDDDGVTEGTEANDWCFDEFWEIWPKKDAKAKALAVWKRLKPDKVLRIQILADVLKRTLSHQWQKDNGDFIPLPASYLNARRWEDQGVHLPNGATNGRTPDGTQFDPAKHTATPLDEPETGDNPGAPDTGGTGGPGLPGQPGERDPGSEGTGGGDPPPDDEDGTEVFP